MRRLAQRYNLQRDLGAMAGPLTVGFWLLMAPPAALILLVTMGSLGRPELFIWHSAPVFVVWMQYQSLRQWHDSPIGTPLRTPSGAFYADDFTEGEFTCLGCGATDKGR